MARVLLFTGESQYNVFERFTRSLALGFKENGHTPIIVDISPNNKNISHSVAEAFSEKPLCAVSFNALGRFRLNDESSIYEKLNIPLIDYMLDHPVHHLARFNKPESTAITTCIDLTHVTFLNNCFGNQLNVQYLPHGGCEDHNLLPVEKKIQILFCGTAINPKDIELEFQTLLPNHIPHINAFLKEIITNEPLPVLDYTSAFAQKNNISDINIQISLLKLFEFYIRAYWRLDILKYLDNAGLTVNIYGNNWEFAQFKNHQTLKPVDFHTSLKLMQQAFFTLNVIPSLPQGAHERIFSAMLNNSIPISDNSQFFKNNNLENNAILFNWTQKQGLTDKINFFLNNPNEYQSLISENKKIASEKHTWGHRANAILQLLKQPANTTPST